VAACVAAELSSLSVGVGLAWCPVAVALKLSQQQQAWDHARSDWEHWRSRVDDEMEAAQASDVIIAVPAACHLYC